MLVIKLAPVYFSHVLQGYVSGNGAMPQRRNPENKVHGANMGPIWGRQDPGGPHVGPMNFAIWERIPSQWKIIFWCQLSIQTTWNKKQIFRQHDLESYTAICPIYPDVTVSLEKGWFLFCYWQLRALDISLIHVKSPYSARVVQRRIYRAHNRTTQFCALYCRTVSGKWYLLCVIQWNHLSGHALS